MLVTNLSLRLERDCHISIRVLLVTSLAAIHLYSAEGSTAHTIEYCSLNDTAARDDTDACPLAGFQACTVRITGGALRRDISRQLEEESDKTRTVEKHYGWRSRSNRMINDNGEGYSDG